MKPIYEVRVPFMYSDKVMKRIRKTLEKAIGEYYCIVILSHDSFKDTIETKVLSPYV